MKSLSLILCLFISLRVAAQNCAPQGTTPCIYTYGGGNGPNIYTPNATLVQTFSAPPLFPCEIAAGDVQFNSFSGITAISCPSSAFNCHGYAWHMEFGGYGQQVWVESDQISKYWNDGSFYEVNFIPQNAKGVVVYANNAHSAVTVPGSNPMKFRSKWGAGYLVEHTPNNVPSGYGAPQRYYLRCGACDAAPNLFQMTYNWGSVSTVNFVSAGGYNLNTNLHPCQLSNNINWSANGNNWGPTGNKNIGAWFNLNAGQSLTFSVSAPSSCGTSNRNVTFVAQSSYRMANTASIKDRLEIEFDNVDYLEILPQQIIIFDEKTGKEELNVDVRELFRAKKLEGKKLTIDVSKLARGMKIVNLLYLNLDSKDVQEKLNKGGIGSVELERKANRIVLTD
jgi:hypothetical protein